MRQPAKFAGIEVLRGIAASMVVLYHVARHLDKEQSHPSLMRIFQSGHAGVDIFFVLSGFIILLVHYQDIGRPISVFRYWRQRFTRVAPLYWIALAATLLLAGLGGHQRPSWGEILWNTLLLPNLGQPILGISWTLQYELIFYFVFSYLIMSRFLGSLLIFVWLLCIFEKFLDWKIKSVVLFISSGYCIECLFGMLAAVIFIFLNIPRSRNFIFWGIGGMILAAVLESAAILDGYGDFARLFYGASSFLLVIGIAARERAGDLDFPSWAKTLGGASYSIYLFQFIFIGVVWKASQMMGLDKRVTAPIMFVILSSAALGGGICTSVLLEKPLLRVMRRQPRTLEPVSASMS